MAGACGHPVEPGEQMVVSEVVEALREESAALVAALRGLDGPEYERVTNCPPWTLAELVVHTGTSLAVPAGFVPAHAGAPVLEAADYYRRPERGTEAYRTSNVALAQEVARSLEPGTDVAGWFSRAAEELADRLEGLDLAVPVEVPRVGAMPIREWAATRVMAVAAHGLDVAITLGRQPWTTSRAIDVCRPVLVALLGAEPPATVGWDGPALLAVGTGRRALTEYERTQLADLADRLPLLS